MKCINTPNEFPIRVKPGEVIKVNGILYKAVKSNVKGISCCVCAFKSDGVKCCALFPCFHGNTDVPEANNYFKRYNNGL